MDDLILQTESPYKHLTLFQQVLQLVLVGVGRIVDLVHLDIMFALLKIEQTLISEVTGRNDIINNVVVVDDRIDAELDVFVDTCLRQFEMLAHVEIIMAFR